MLDRKFFSDCLQILQFNFQFDCPEEYLDLVYDKIKSITGKKRLMFCINQLIDTKNLKDWNKEFGYKGRMSVKDWLDLLIPAKIIVGYTQAKFNGNSHKLPIYEFPADYLADLNQSKNDLQGQQSIENQKQVKTYTKTITTNLKSK